MVFDLNVGGGNKQWEYKCQPKERVDQEWMNDQGLNGWELVSVVESTGWVWHIFKRQRTD